MAENNQNGQRPNHEEREKLYRIIFGTETPTGRAFDITLLILIVISVILVMLESVEELNRKYHSIFIVLEWVLTIVFTIEYLVRIYIVRRPLKYMTSFFGIVDFLAILPSYLTLFLIDAHYFLAVRALRLLRIFRVFKLGRYLKESQKLIRALQRSREKITVFLIGVLTCVTVIGAMMYLVESNANSGFDSIPRSIYWAIVTITTVGYGDIAPATTLGQFLAAILMIMGYGVIAVPTGIVTSELVQQKNKTTEQLQEEIKEEISEITSAMEDMQFVKPLVPKSDAQCSHCEHTGHDVDAKFCKYCGEIL